MKKEEEEEEEVEQKISQNKTETYSSLPNL
jgi:hypothetical protein